MVCASVLWIDFDQIHSPTEGENMSLLSIQREFKDEYSALSKEEHEEIVREYKENTDGTKHLACPSPRGRIQDFSNTVRNLIMLVGDVL